MAPVLAVTAEAPGDAETGERDERYDEVWDGELVVPPMPNMFHQYLVAELTVALHAVVRRGGVGRVYPGLNVSPLADGWRQDFRCPDVAVYLGGNPAVEHVAHMQGGPDLAVEIVSAEEDPHAKLGFYAAVGTREVLVINRAGDWSLELFRLAGGVLLAAGAAGPGGPAVGSEAVGVAFSLAAAEPRPALVVAHAASGQVWRA